MNILDTLPLATEVLKDWRVIFIAVLTIFFISLGNYVVKYKRKPPRIVIEKPAPAPAKKDESKENEDESEEAAE